MISYLNGHVLKIGPNFALVRAGAIGVRVFMTSRALSTIRHGEDVEIYTNLVVREDSLTLFGFLSEDDSETFDILQGVKGVGPRTAMAALDVFTPDELRSALEAGDEKQLQKIPGVGKKSAQRLILDIGDKLGPARGLVTQVAPDDEAANEVIAALQGLGWQKQQAEAAVEQFAGSGLSTSDMLRAALVNLGGNRG